MFKTIVTATVITLAFAGMAEAKKAKMAAAPMATRGSDATGQFYATPIQKGAPTDLPGQRLIPGASEAAMVIDGVVGPIVPVTQQVGAGVGRTVGGVIDPIGGAIGGPVVAADAGPAPMARGHRHHHHHHHHMMKRKMMKKRM